MTNTTVEKFHSYFPVLLDVMAGKATIQAAANHFHTTAYHIKKLIRRHVPQYFNLTQTNFIKIYKDQDLIIRHHSKNAGLLGDRNLRGNLTNLSDYDIRPDYADIYVAISERTMRKQITSVERKPILHQQLGQITATASSVPVIGNEGDCIGVYHFLDTSVSLKHMSFAKAFNLLKQGLAPQFINQKQYAMKIKNKALYIILYPRECECLLYLIIGCNSKAIASYMNISTRSVECLIEKLKSKLGVYSRQELPTLLMECDFLSYF